MKHGLTFNIHGVTVQLEGDSATILEQTRQELRFFQCEPLSPTTIRATLTQEADLRMDRTPEEDLRRDAGDEINWISNDIASVLNIPNRTVNLYLHPSAPEDAAVVILFGVIGYMVHLELSLRGDVAAFHGASLYKDGRALLLLGKTNSGKTSLSYLLRSHGVSYLSEEDSFILRTGEQRFQVLPYPRRIRIPQEVMRQQPQLDQMPHDRILVESLEDEVYRMDPREPFPDISPLKHVVFLDNDPRHGTVSIGPMEKTEALFSLLSSLETSRIEESPQTVWNDLKTSNRAGFSVAKSIVDSFTVKRVKYNIIRDFSVMGRLISDLLKAD